MCLLVGVPCSAVLCRAVFTQVDLAVQLFPGVAAAPLILGTLSGCGGRLLADAIMTSWQVSQSGWVVE